MSKSLYTRRKVIAASVAGLAVSYVPLIALGGKGWCRMDPQGTFDGQPVYWEGDVWTEPQFIVPGSAQFDVHVPTGHTFVLTNDPDCQVNIVPTWRQRWKIIFRYQTTNGDNSAKIIVDALGPGAIFDYTKIFSGYENEVTYPV